MNYEDMNLTLRDKIALEVMANVLKDNEQDMDEYRREDYEGFVANEVDSAYTYADAILKRRKMKEVEE